MIADFKETKEKQGVQQLCILIYLAEKNVQASQIKGGCFVCGYPGHFPSNVAKKVQLIVQSAKKGTFTKTCRSKPDKTATKQRDPFTSYSQCMNSGTEIRSIAGKLNLLIIDTGCTR